MKKNFTLILLIIVLTSCKSFELSQMVPANTPINPLLPTLEDYANSTVGASQDELNFFTKEVEQNLIDPYGDKHGYIVLRRIRYEVKLGLGWSFVGGFLVCVPFLFGAPASTPKFKMTYEVRILDKNRKLIGKYEGTGIGKAAAAMYWGYNIKGAVRKAYTDAWNNAFSQIRTQIQKDSGRLTEALTK